MDGKNLLRVFDCLEALAELSEDKGFAARLHELPDNEIDVAPDLRDKAIELIGKIPVKKREPKRKSVRSHRQSLNTPSSPSPISSPVVPIRMELSTTALHKMEDSQVRETFVAFVAIMRGHLARKKFKKRKRANALRRNISKEILSTEEIYVNNLAILIKMFRDPLLKFCEKKKIVEPERIKSIFTDITIILGYNSKLLEDISKRMENWDPNRCLGDIFLTITQYLKVYTNYVQKYEATLLVIHELRKNKKCAELMEAIREDPETHMHDIEAQLLKNTLPDHADFQNLTLAQTKMEEVGNYVNEKKREYENITRVREVQALFDGKVELVEPSRKWIRTDVVVPFGDPKNTEYIVSMFNDILVIGQTAGKKLKLKDQFKLKNLKLKPQSLRKWTIKVDQSPMSRSRAKSSVGSTPLENTLSSAISDFNLNSSGKRTSLSIASRLGRSSAQRNSIFSSRNTVELVNIKEETVLKICFEDSLTMASWESDFAGAQEILSENETKKSAKMMDQAFRQSKDTKQALTKNLSLSPQEKKEAYQKRMEARNTPPPSPNPRPQ
eukprot:TRINITY_DN2489_c0_g1_i1.p1 TRINITY_DN2489_c0_g1~~TRINITY_DN2489_c0_g1_i1.p1  ORF type:complete len:651 (-),score=235.46 TRINITY_DN2489_c0_g1_i1:21-1685(-)